MERGHQTLRIIGKGNKPAVIPLVPRTARTIDLAVGERSEGPILHRRDGHRLDRRTAHRWVGSIGKRAGLGLVHPHMLPSAFIMGALDAGLPLETSNSPPDARIRAPRRSTTGGAPTSIATPPTSWWPSLPAGNRIDPYRRFGDDRLASKPGAEAPGILHFVIWKDVPTRPSRVR
jgi:hypothetical protein